MDAPDRPSQTVISEKGGLNLAHRAAITAVETVDKKPYQLRVPVAARLVQLPVPPPRHHESVHYPVHIHQDRCIVDDQSSPQLLSIPE